MSFNNTFSFICISQEIFLVHEYILCNAAYLTALIYGKLQREFNCVTSTGLAYSR